MAERRFETRMMCADLVEVSWQIGKGRKQRLVANLEDISSKGACLQLEDEIPLRTMVLVKCGKNEYSGEVRYCVYREFGYFVGIQFDSGTKWTENSFRPLHLFNPQMLTDKRPAKSSR